MAEGRPAANVCSPTHAHAHTPQLDLHGCFVSEAIERLQKWVLGEGGAMRPSCGGCSVAGRGPLAGGVAKSPVAEERRRGGSTGERAQGCSLPTHAAKQQPPPLAGTSARWLRWSTQGVCWCRWAAQGWACCCCCCCCCRGCHSNGLQGSPWSSLQGGCRAAQAHCPSPVSALARRPRETLALLARPPAAGHHGAGQAQRGRAAACVARGGGVAQRARLRV